MYTYLLSYYYYIFIPIWWFALIVFFDYKVLLIVDFYDAKNQKFNNTA